MTLHIFTSFAPPELLIFADCHSLPPSRQGLRLHSPRELLVLDALRHDRILVQPPFLEITVTEITVITVTVHSFDRRFYIFTVECTVTVICEHPALWRQENSLQAVQDQARLSRARCQCVVGLARPAAPLNFHRRHAPQPRRLRRPVQISADLISGVYSGRPAFLNPSTKRAKSSSRLIGKRCLRLLSLNAGSEARIKDTI